MESVTVFTIATRAERGFHEYFVSCIRNGITPKVLGMGRRWEGFTHKIRLVRERIDRYHPDALVVVTDCYDLVFQKGKEELIRTFNLYDKPIVFSAERGIGNPIRCTELPETPNPMYRALCAGFWMARAGAAREMVDEGWGDRLCDSSIDDQGMLQDWFRHNHNKATVDYLNEIVCTTEDQSYYDDLEYRDGVVYNKHTNTAPCAIHVAAKGDMREVYKTLDLVDHGRRF